MRLFSVTKVGGLLTQVEIDQEENQEKERGVGGSCERLQLEGMTRLDGVDGGSPRRHSDDSDEGVC